MAANPDEVAETIHEPLIAKHPPALDASIKLIPPVTPVDVAVNPNAPPIASSVPGEVDPIPTLEFTPSIEKIGAVLTPVEKLNALTAAGMVEVDDEANERLIPERIS